MNALKKLSNLFGRYMAVIVIAVAALALLAPGTVSFIKTSYVNTLLGIVMFGMGLTLKPGDFKVVFSRPKDVIIGSIAQFTLMPLLAFLLTKLFRLPPELRPAAPASRKGSPPWLSPRPPPSYPLPSWPLSPDTYSLPPWWICIP